MKYEAPELNPASAIRAIQNSIQAKAKHFMCDHFVTQHFNEPGPCYADWEE